MTPGARLSAAIDVLDRYLAGAPLEQALTNWGRASRFAGSGDRAAVRDIVFDAVRCRRSFAMLGGSETGRGLVLGGLRATMTPIEPLFDGTGHNPAPLAEPDQPLPRAMTQAERLDCPDWLLPLLADSLGGDVEQVLQTLQRRAPVFLRINTRRIDRVAAIELLAEQGITAIPAELATTAVEVVAHARKVAASGAYTDGLVELQDAASQAVIELLPLADGMRVLDYCAGGGGKSLAMGARARLSLTAHDANEGRLRDLPARAARAGITIDVADSKALARQPAFDLVLTDVPCSGSGAWRRAPVGKWALTRESLTDLCAAQAGILDTAGKLVRPGGHLAFVTCSMLGLENGAQTARFIERNPMFVSVFSRQFTPMDGGDGFYVELLQRN